MNRLLLVAITFVAVALLGCSDDPVAPLSYDGANGFSADKIAFTMIDNTVKNYEKLRIDFAKSSMEFIDAQGIQRGLRLADFILDRREVELLLALPANAKGPGEYVWVDGTAPSTIEAYVILTRDDVEYTSVSGRTIITVYGDVGEPVEGTFSGTIRHPETYALTEVVGRFKAHRVH